MCLTTREFCLGRLSPTTNLHCYYCREGLWALDRSFVLDIELDESASEPMAEPTPWQWVAVISTEDSGYLISPAYSPSHM